MRDAVKAAFSMRFLAIIWPLDEESKEIVSELLSEYLSGQSADGIKKHNLLVWGEQIGERDRQAYLDSVRNMLSIHYFGRKPFSLREAMLFSVIKSVSYGSTSFEMHDLSSSKTYSSQNVRSTSRMVEEISRSLARLPKGEAAADYRQLAQGLKYVVGISSLCKHPLGIRLTKRANVLANVLALEAEIWMGAEKRSSGRVRSLNNFAEITQSPIFALAKDFELMSKKLTGSVAELVQERGRYLRHGQLLAERARCEPPFIDTISLFAWWSHLFRICAVQRARGGDHLVGVSFLTRELEQMCCGVLIEVGEAEFDLKGNLQLSSGSRPRGAGELLAAVENLLGRRACDSCVRSLYELTECRNRSQLGHGTSSLNASIFKKSISLISSFWADLLQLHYKVAISVTPLRPMAKVTLVSKPAEILTQACFDDDT
ncbi:MAG: hypothetical protein WD672_07460 [Woeseia sp.]